MTTIQRTIQYRAAINSAPCEVPYCTARRFGASRHCQPHAKRFRKYGSPHGRKVFPREYAALRTQAADLFSKNPHHPGLIAALAAVDHWGKSAAAGDTSVPAAAQMARLHAHGVSALRVIEECAAVWAYLCRGAPPEDIARLDFALANAAFSLAPLELHRTYQYGERKVRTYKSVPRTDRSAAGAFIRQSLCTFLHHTATAVLRSPEAQREELLRAYTAPFQHRNLMIPTPT